MLLLFWTGVRDGVGTLNGQSVLTGIADRIRIGEGSIICVSSLTGDGGALSYGVGSIACISVLLGVADAITPEATYLFTIVGRDGAAYSFVGELADAPEYKAGEAGGTVEYTHKPVGRRIP